MTTETCERVCAFLTELERRDLARLLEHAAYTAVEVPDDWFPTTQVCLRAPAPYDEALAGLPHFEKERIVEAIQRTDASLATIQKPALLIELDGSRDLADEQKLFGEVVVERNMLIDVGTGGKRIEAVNDYYRPRRKRIHRQLAAMGLDDPNPFEDLWDWYRRYSVEMGAYKERRTFIHAMYRPLLEHLGVKPTEPAPARDPTGWERVDRAMDRARSEMERATKEEDFQAIGLLCRELLISLAQAVFVAGRHEALDGTKASETDAKRMLDAYFAVELAGSADEDTRRYARAALSLANTLQHKRTADFRLAALCLEATSSVVNTVTIVSGQRDRK